MQKNRFLDEMLARHFDCYAATLTQYWPKFQNGCLLRNRNFGSSSAVSPFSKFSCDYVRILFSVLSNRFAVYAVFILNTHTRCALFFFFIVEPMSKFCLHKNPTPISMNSSLNSVLWIFVYFVCFSCRKLRNVLWVYKFFFFENKKNCLLLLLVFRGLNRYDLERLLNGFAVCAVNIYITTNVRVESSLCGEHHT